MIITVVQTGLSFDLSQQGSEQSKSLSEINQSFDWDTDVYVTFMCQFNSVLRIRVKL